MTDITPTLGKILPNDRLPNDLVDAFKLRHRLFYTLPDSLLLAIDDALPEAITAEAIELEARLSRSLRTDVAVRNEQPVSFIRLAACVTRVDQNVCHFSANPDLIVADLAATLQDAHDWSQGWGCWFNAQSFNPTSRRFGS